MAIQSNRRPIFGMNCTRCGDLLIAPEWSEYEDERHVLHLWSSQTAAANSKPRHFCLPPSR
jgi:hypothetical protein